MKHARLSPSSSHRWANCTASVAAIAALNLPYQSSGAADDGTFSHTYHEHLLRNGQPAEWALGSTGKINGKEYVVDAERCQRLQASLDYIRPFITERAEVWLERAVNLFYDDGNGYCDVSMYIPETKALHVFDYKDGWTFVPVQGNEQFRIYAACLYEELIEEFYEIESIHCHVCQPRVNNFACETLTPDELTDFMGFIQTQAKIITETPELCTFVASEKACTWCDLGRLGQCKAQAEQAADLIQLEFDDLTTPEPVQTLNPGQMTPIEIAHIYRNIGTVQTFIKQMTARAQELTEAGELPGFKRVQSFGNRKWTDDDEAIKFMKGTLKLKRDQMFPPKPVTPPQLEKIVDFKTLSTRAANRLSELITRPESSIIVPMTDKRDALPIIADEFEAIETTTTIEDDFDF